MSDAAPFMSTTCVVTLSADRKRATMVTQGFGVTHKRIMPVGHLPGQIKLYQGFIAKRPHTEKFYRPCIEAIERAMKRLESEA